MKKRWWILIIVGIIVLILILLIILCLIFGNISFFQSVSTDKKIYSVGETINVNWVDIGINSASCFQGARMRVYKSVKGWEKIKYEMSILDGDWAACIDKKNESVYRVILCNNPKWTFPKPYYLKGSYPLKVKLEEDGYFNCYSGHDELKNYKLSNLTEGHYKVQKGLSKAYFEVK